MSIAANQNGVVTGSFTIPSGIPAGSKLVQFNGEQHEARASFVGRGVLDIQELRSIQSITAFAPRAADPLAQTFMLERATQLSAVDLWFAAVGTSNVLIQIREVELGLPTQRVVAESMLAPGDINTTAHTRAYFQSAALEAGREYAIVIMCDDATTAVRVAELGKYDISASRWVTSQPYTVGVLLSSSNAFTWTPHQEKDLTFRLIATDFNVLTNDISGDVVSKTVTLDPVSVTDIDHLLVMAAVERPSERTDVVFNITAGTNTYTVTEGQPITLPEKYTGQVTWTATLIGTANETPRLHRDIQLITAIRIASSDYVSRAMLTNGGTTITVYFDAIKPGSSNVAVDVENGAGVWASCALDSSVPLGGDWAEYKHVLTGFAQTETRLKLTLTGTAVAIPRVRNLRMVIT